MSALFRRLFAAIRRRPIVSACVAAGLCGAVVFGAMALAAVTSAPQRGAKKSWRDIRAAITRPLKVVSREVGTLTRLSTTDNGLDLAYVDREQQKVMFAHTALPPSSWPPPSPTAVTEIAKGGEHMAMARGGDLVHICHTNNTTETLACSSSRDGGAHWHARDSHVVDPTVGVGQFVSVAARGDEVFVAYSYEMKREVRFARSPDGGLTWPEELRRVVDGTATSRGGRYVGIIATPTRLLIAYQGAYGEPRDGQSLRVASSDDNGSTWMTAAIDGPSCSLGTHAAMAYASGTVAIAYSDRSSLRFVHSGDEGRSWHKKSISVVATSERKRAYKYLSLRLDPPAADIAYLEYKSLKVASTADLGATWSVATVVDVGRFGYGTAVVGVGGSLYLSYFEAHKPQPGLATSGDGGHSWTSGDRGSHAQAQLSSQP